MNLNEYLDRAVEYVAGNRSTSSADIGHNHPEIDWRGAVEFGEMLRRGSLSCSPTMSLHTSMVDVRGAVKFGEMLERGKVVKA
jgi:hypothetical protein